MAVELLQDAIVTAVALGAGVVVARRVVGSMLIKDAGHEGCDKCAVSPSPRLASHLESGHAPAPSATVHPLVVIRRATSSRSTSA